MLRVLDLLAEGWTISKACDAAGVTTVTFKKFTDSQPELREAFADAQQHGYDRMAEMLLEIDSNPLYGSGDARMANVISSNIKWFLARRNSAGYGDKLAVEHVITADKAVTEALSRAQARTAQRVIEGVAYEVVNTLVQDVVDEVPAGFTADEWAEFQELV